MFNIALVMSEPKIMKLFVMSDLCLEYVSKLSLERCPHPFRGGLRSAETAKSHYGRDQHPPEC
eukprot:3999125-Pyramimonas_sp.AAC.1